MDIETNPVALTKPCAVHHYSLRTPWTEDGGEEVDVCEPCAAKHMPAVNGDLVTATAADTDTMCDYCQPERTHGR